MSGSFGNGLLESDFVIDRKAGIFGTLSGLRSEFERGMSLELVEL
jgi:hypothetical protein